MVSESLSGVEGAPAFIRDLERQAQAAARAEADYRLEVRDRLTALETARVSAYRRLNLLGGMQGAMATVPEDAAAIAAGIDHVCGRTGWSPADVAYDEFRRQLEPVGQAMRAVCQPPAPERPAAAPQAPLLAFASFEAWYRARFDADFLALLASDAPVFQSVVDF
jgi:hypothetical protein